MRSSQILQTDLRSFAIVFSALLGNAQIFGFDLFIFALAPAIFLMQIARMQPIRKKNAFALFWLLVLLILSAFRASELDIPYFENYWLWPIKSIVLTLLLVFGNDVRWPIGNTILLAALSFFLVAVGNMQDGRLYSLLGPNMLYRVFGFLLLSSVMSYSVRSNVNTFISTTVFCFAIVALILTGSTGALLAILSVFFFVLLRVTVRVRVFLILGATVILVVFRQVMLRGIGDLSIFSRLIYKLENIYQYDRFTVWSEILSSPFRILGYNYDDFSHLWFFGVQYPHNFAVELYGFYGVLGILFFPLLVAVCIRSIKAIPGGNTSAMVFLILLLGSLLSGDLSENFAIISFAIAVMLKGKESQPATRDGTVI